MKKLKKTFWGILDFGLISKNQKAEKYDRKLMAKKFIGRIEKENKKFLERLNCLAVGNTPGDISNVSKYTEYTKLFYNKMKLPPINMNTPNNSISSSNFHKLCVYLITDYERRDLSLRLKRKPL